MQRPIKFCGCIHSSVIPRNLRNSFSATTCKFGWNLSGIFTFFPLPIFLVLMPLWSFFPQYRYFLKCYFLQPLLANNRQKVIRTDFYWNSKFSQYLNIIWIDTRKYITINNIFFFPLKNFKHTTICRTCLQASQQKCVGHHGVMPGPIFPGCQLEGALGGGRIPLAAELGNKYATRTQGYVHIGLILRQLITQGQS